MKFQRIIGNIHLASSIKIYSCSIKVLSEKIVRITFKWRPVPPFGVKIANVRRLLECAILKNIKRNPKMLKDVKWCAVQITHFPRLLDFGP